MLNRLLTKALLAALFMNGCLAMALVDEMHRERAGRERIAAAIPSQTLHVMPMPGKHGKAVRS